MVYVLCDELQSAQAKEFQPPFPGMFYACIFWHFNFDIRVEFNMFFTFVLIVAE
jgi:hypothetical protein